MQQPTATIELTETDLAMLIFAAKQTFSMTEAEAIALVNKLQGHKSALINQRINAQ